MALSVDLNCDLGEGVGPDESLMPLITSANIACGAHAGDPSTMRTTVALARAAGVAVGAHPGYADRENFGRRDREMPPREAAELVVAQTELLRRIAQEEGVEVTHVKLHGALYNRAARDRDLAEEIIRAVWGGAWRPRLVVLSGSVFDQVARARDPRNVASEVFADRAYRADGSLLPRTSDGALIEDEAVAVAQVLRLIREGVVRATDGQEVRMRADTVCLHGDGAHPLEFARRLRQELATAGIAVKGMHQ